MEISDRSQIARAVPAGSPAEEAFLLEHVHGAAVGGDLVFLDLKADEYACLRDRAAGADRDEDGSVGRLHPEAAADLVAEGLASFDACRREGPALPARAAADLTAAPDVPLSVRDLWTFAQAVAAVRLLGDDPTVRTYLTLSAASPARADPGEIVRIALVVRRLLPWSPLPGQCLVRSAVLVAFLRRRGLAAHWVFGVRTWPFRAHCWVQHDGVCLNDDADRLRAYTPLLCR